VTAVTITDGPMSLDDLAAIVDGATVEIGEAATERIAASRAVVEAVLAGEDLVYGLNTGLGHMRDTRVPRDVLRRYQEAIVVSHAGAMGDPLPSGVVRAAMVARLNGIARGGSGATPAVASMLAAMLNAGVTPVVPAIGSVGASDLMHMAAIGLVVLGRGRAQLDGETLDGGEALARAGLDPLVLEPKDGLALVSANGVAIGHGTLVALRAHEVLELADLAAALALEAIAGNPSIVEPAVAAAKPIPGQRTVVERIRGLLSGSDRCRPGGAMSVQDPLAFRVVPQVHGACLEMLEALCGAVEQELNAMDDNPLASIEEQRLLSNGNFHPMLMALSFDAIRPALAHVGQLADRRMGHIWDKLVASEELSSPDGMLEAALGEGRAIMLRYAAAARYAHLRQLAAPATLDIPPLDLGVEDHATNAPETVQRTSESLDALEDILAEELLLHRLALSSPMARAGLGGGTAAVLTELDRIVGALPPEADPGAWHAAVRAGRGALLAASREALS
jgi:histidine ammonia-lyase